MDYSKVEKKILPLVKAINNTGIFHTFSSCEGHYEDADQELMDRNHADVRFERLNGTTLKETEHFITFLMSEFNKIHGFTPITLYGEKLYAPQYEYKPNYVFVITLEPFDRFDTPKKKRKDTDKAILQAADVVKAYSKLFL
jgi:hypothetical protein